MFSSWPAPLQAASTAGQWPGDRPLDFRLGRPFFRSSGAPAERVAARYLCWLMIGDYTTQILPNIVGIIITQKRNPESLWKHTHFKRLSTSWNVWFIQCDVKFQTVQGSKPAKSSRAFCSAKTRRTHAALVLALHQFFVVLQIHWVSQNPMEILWIYVWYRMNLRWKSVGSWISSSFHHHFLLLTATTWDLRHFPTGSLGSWAPATTGTTAMDRTRPDTTLLAVPSGSWWSMAEATLVPETAPCHWVGSWDTQELLRS